MKLPMDVHHPLDLWNVPAWFGQQLSQEFPQLQIRQRESHAGSEQALRAEQLAAAPKLRWIHAPSAAVHEFLFADLVNSDVLVTNSREVHGPVVAEQAMALILALAKKIPQAALLQQKHPVQLWV